MENDFASGNGRARKRRLGGLYKRCSCPQAQWKRCHKDDHAWYHAFKPKGGTLERKCLGVMTWEEAKIKRDELRTKLREQAKTGSQSNGRMILDDVAKLFAIGRPRNVYLDVLCRIELPRPDGTTVRLGSKRLDDISVSDLLAAIEVYKLTAQKRASGGRVGIRKLLQAGRHLWNWAIDTDKTNRSPFYRNGRPARVLAPYLAYKARRDRRLQDGEEARLLKHADAYIHDLIVAILDTGLRGGSLRSLQWSDVQGQHLVVPPSKQKRGKGALRIRISPRLKAVLDTRRNGPDGEPLADDALIFGDETGRPVGRERFGELWRATCRRAKILDLYFHDLRGEAGSRLLEAGVPLNDVRDALGHTSVTMTDTYLRARTAALDAAFGALHAAHGKVLPFRNSTKHCTGNRRSARNSTKSA